MQAKKLFAPPDKPDATKNHLILKVNQGFETLAMEICDLIPRSPKLDSFVQELHKVRLQVVFDIEHAKTGKKEEASAATAPPKKQRGGKTPPAASAETKNLTIADVPTSLTQPAPEQDDEDATDDDENNNDNEGFE